MIRRLSVYSFFMQGGCDCLPALVLLATAGSGAAFWPYLGGGLPLLLAWLLCVRHYRLGELETLYLPGHEWGDCLKAVAASSLVSVLSLAASPWSASPWLLRRLVGLRAALLLGGVLLWRALFRWLLQRAGQRRPLRVLMVGSDEFAARTAHHLIGNGMLPCRLAGFVHLPGQPVAVADGARVLAWRELGGKRWAGRVDEVVIAASPAVLPQLSQLIHRLREMAVPIRCCLELGPEFAVRERFYRIAGAQMLDVAVAPSEMVNYVLLKRAFDVVFSVVALLLAALPMLLIALAVKWSSPGPVFFVQDRVGLNGQSFRMIKFRTMRVVASAISDRSWSTVDEARCTALGVFLRRSSLDELPQFFNVLRGEMSVVGPRPERPFFVAKFSDEVAAYNMRHHVKSGITGWAQVHGLRGDTDIAQRVELDLYYLKNWSLAFDLRIIGRTLWVLLSEWAQRMPLSLRGSA